MAHSAVLLDTSFFIRFLKMDDPLFANADAYFRHFLERDIPMVLSTICVAEYCVRGRIEELPLRNVQILPFNINHGQRAGVLAQEAFAARSQGSLQVESRAVIPNDTKLFAQADCEASIGCYLSADRESKRIYDLLRSTQSLNFTFIDLHDSPADSFGMLNL